jgi:hypothetical protein
MDSIPDDLQNDLRAAMAIELTTIPAYLYAYWSIKPVGEGGSQAAAEAARTIMSVVDEEMLHMGLVSNILNALGGSPALTDPTYVPRYPGPLMRHVAELPAQNITVFLSPLAAPAIDLFLQIELPEWPPSKRPAGQAPSTIAQFYEQVEQKLTTGLDYSYGKQLKVWDNPGVGRLVPVADQPSAITAIGQIIEQGEGLKRGDHEDGQHELAHYWKFREVKDNIDADNIDLARDVYPIVANPQASRYSPAQQQANLAFNSAYSDLLDALQEVFCGDQPALREQDRPDVFKPSASYDAPTRYMDRLGQLAAVLRNQGAVPGTQDLAGPTFEYIPKDRRVRELELASAKL